MKNHKKPQSRKMVMLALRESMLGYQSHSDESLLIIEDDLKALSQLELIETTALAISKLDDEIFSVKAEQRTGRRFIENGPLGKALYLSLKIPLDEIVMYFPLHTFSPYFNAFREAVKRHELDQIPCYPLKIFRDEEAEALVARMNSFAETLRMETRTPEFKAAIRKTQRSCNKNFKGFMTYLHELFQKKGRLLGLRVDFGYKKISNFDQAGSDVSYEEVKRHREALIDEIRKRFKDVLVGYVWKLEYGLLKGYHIHVLIFLDGSKVREDVTIAKMLGEHWNSILTGGLGAYHNCNAKKSSYRFCGIGMLRHDDPQIWEGLEKIATYLTKPDYYVKLNMPGNDHALGKGGPPKQYAKKRGRPRKSGDTPD